MKLNPHVPYLPGETLASWTERLAVTHCAGSREAFLTDIGLDPKDIRVGRRSSVAQLCEVAGTDLDPVLNGIITARSNVSYAWKGQELAITHLSRPRVRFCPACLRADDQSSHGRWHRTIWCLDAFRVCPDHNLLLMERSGGEGSVSFTSLAATVPEDSRGLEVLTDGLEEIPPNSLQDYLCRRLSRGKTGHWLDTLPLGEACRLVERAGGLVSFGPGASEAELSPAQWVEAGRAGWVLIGSSRDEYLNSLRDFLKASRSDFNFTSHTPSIRLGMLWSALDLYGSGLASRGLQKLHWEFLEETFASRRNPPRSGQRGMRRLHSRLIDFAGWTTADRKCVTAILDRRRVAPSFTEFATPSDRALSRIYPRLEAAVAFEAHDRAVLGADMLSLLTRDNGTIGILVRLGYLGEVDAFDTKPLKPRVAIDRLDLAVLFQIASEIPRLDEIPKGWVTIREGMNSGKDRALSKVLPLVLGEPIYGVGTISDTGSLNSVFIDPSLLDTSEEQQFYGMSVATAVRLLRLGDPHPAMNGVAQQYLGPSNRGPTGPRVRHDAVVRFRKKFATLERLRLEIGMSRAETRRLLEDAGVSPVSCDDSEVWPIYLRDSLPRRLFG